LGNFGIYFDLSDPVSLCQTIESFESEDSTRRKAMLASWEWISWQDSTKQLLDRVKKHLDRHYPAVRGSKVKM
jgi:alpha-1,2-rhamnosyltransferase